MRDQARATARLPELSWGALDPAGLRAHTRVLLREDSAPRYNDFSGLSRVECPGSP